MARPSSVSWRPCPHAWARDPRVARLTDRQARVFYALLHAIDHRGRFELDEASIRIATGIVTGPSVLDTIGHLAKAGLIEPAEHGQAKIAEYESDTPMRGPKPEGDSGTKPGGNVPGNVPKTPRVRGTKQHRNVPGNVPAEGTKQPGNVPGTAESLSPPHPPSLYAPTGHEERERRVGLTHAERPAPSGRPAESQQAAPVPGARRPALGGADRAPVGDSGGDVPAELPDADLDAELARLADSWTSRPVESVSVERSPPPRRCDYATVAGYETARQAWLGVSP